MKIQLSIINDKITVHYMDEDTPYMKSNYVEYKNLSEDDKNKVDEAVNYFKELNTDERER